MICEGSFEGDGDHDGEDHDDEKDQGRMLDGHMPTNSTMGEDMDGDMDGMDVRCMKAYRLLHSMEEFANEDTTEERREEISEMWSQGLEDAWAELMMDGATTIATTMVGIASAVAVLSF